MGRFTSLIRRSIGGALSSFNDDRKRAVGVSHLFLLAFLLQKESCLRLSDMFVTHFTAKAAKTSSVDAGQCTANMLSSHQLKGTYRQLSMVAI